VLCTKTELASTAFSENEDIKALSKRIVDGR
jgi:hypothetical protein